MHRLFILAAACGTLTLAACGDTATPPETEVNLLPAQAQPPAATAPGALATIADGGTAQRRIGYVNLAAAASFGGPLSPTELRRLTLGDGGAQAANQRAGAGTAIQVGEATIIDPAGEQRQVVGGSSALRARLADPTPPSSVITPETQSAVQSCLGDSVAEVIVGPAVVGRLAAIGAGVADTDDAPAGRKLRICAAPHYVREVHAVEDRLTAMFPGEGLTPAQQPVIGENEIGEREIMQATVPLDAVDPALLRDLLRGGPALVELAQG